MAIDATASAALSATVIKPVFFAFIDFENEPIRVNTSGADITPVGTGEPDLDGFLFSGLRADILDIGAVSNKGAGTDSLQLRVSGLQGVDADMLAEVADPTHWRGRELRLWRVIRNAANVQQGGFQHYYTGNMTGITMPTSASEQAIELNVESYVSAYAEASNRTYLDQERYDAGDLSAKAGIAIGNNAGGGSPAGQPLAVTGGSGGGTIRDNPRLARS